MSEELTARLEQEIASLDRILQMNRVLATERDLRKLLQAILDTAIYLTNAERGFLLLAEGGGLKVEVARNIDHEEIERPDLQISRSIAKQVMETGQWVMAEDAKADTRFATTDSIASFRLSSVLCMPLTVKKQMIGAIYLDNRYYRGAFRQLEQDILGAFTEQAAIAIDNARLLKDLQEARDTAEHLHRQLAASTRNLEVQVESQVLELEQVSRRLEEGQKALTTRYSYQSIIGRSPPMQEVYSLLEAIKPKHLPVLIEGESGTGKELVAKAIHYTSGRRRKPFAAENFAAISETLIESELFGHEKGAFTGADRDQAGLFEVADGGTLFLDEIGDMSMDMQKKLLRVLQEGQIRRVGAKEVIEIDVRIIAATNKNLKKLVEEQRFREDLFYRLNVIYLRMPALRERKEDIPQLIGQWFKEAREKGKLKVSGFSREAMDLVMRYHWPGNVRELKNFIDRVLVFAAGGEVTAVEVESHLSGMAENASAGWMGLEGNNYRDGKVKMLEHFDRLMIEQALRTCHGNVSQAAKMLEIERRYFHKIMKKCQFRSGDFRY